MERDMKMIKKVKTKRIGEGLYETTNTERKFYIEKSHEWGCEGGNYWTIFDSVYYDDCDQINGYWDTYFTKKTCLEVIGEMSN